MTIPRASGFDQSLHFVRDGYDFIARQCDALATDIFQGRLMLRNVVCMRGAPAAELLYDSDKFTRVGAMPVTILMLLQDFGSVQLLHGDAHRHRKAMFLEIGRPQVAATLAAHFIEVWEKALPRWKRAPRIVLFSEMEAMLTRCGAAWAGIPLSEEEARLRTREYSEMLAATGTFGPGTLRALWLRQHTERWARDILARVRAGEMTPPPDSAVYKVAHHRDLEGKPLAVKIAAVELLNVLRAIVAVGRFIAFAGKALIEHPGARERIASGDARYVRNFVEEVRRTTPFFPIIGGRARADFHALGHAFRKGDWALLDLFGTDLHPRIWPEPARFDPDRFLEKAPSAFELIPQGAGDPAVTHRCPGEDLTLALMGAAVRQLSVALTYDVPDQDLSVSRTTIPALPASGVILSSIRERPPVPQHAATAAEGDA